MLVAFRSPLSRLSKAAQKRLGLSWDESAHPRGQSQNPGQFTRKPGATATAPQAPKPANGPAAPVTGGRKPLTPLNTPTRLKFGVEDLVFTEAEKARSPYTWRVKEITRRIGHIMEPMAMWALSDEMIDALRREVVANDDQVGQMMVDIHRNMRASFSNAQKDDARGVIVAMLKQAVGREEDGTNGEANGNGNGNGHVRKALVALTLEEAFLPPAAPRTGAVQRFLGWLRKSQMSLFDETKHPRHSKGPRGGQFAPKGKKQAASAGAQGNLFADKPAPAEVHKPVAAAAPVEAAPEPEVVADGLTVRPAHFRHYTDEGRVAHWEVSEEEYLQERVAREERRLEGQVRYYTEQLAAMGPRTGARKRAEAEAFLGMFQRDLEKFRAEGPKPAHLQKWREDYIALVGKAISKGEPVPEEVIAQRPEFATARTARQRYEKGRHTSFANRSAAINDTMQQAAGYKVKRQDGKPITPEQIEEIEVGVAEIASVVGEDIRRLLRETDATIAHTSGKHPFLQTSGGCYSPTEKTITMGTISQGGREVRALAHELGHWLDIEAGKREGVKVYVGEGSRGRGQYSSSLAEGENAYMVGGLIGRARRLINHEYEVTRLLKKPKKNISPEEQEERALVRVSLGAYWRRPREIFARLFEQYIATRIGDPKVAARGDLHRAAGWWTADDFAGLVPDIEREIARRIEILGGNGNGHVRKALGALTLEEAFLPPAAPRTGAVQRFLGWLRKSQMSLFDEDLHPRHPAGSEKGGQFREKRSVAVIGGNQKPAPVQAAAQASVPNAFLAPDGMLLPLGRSENHKMWLAAHRKTLTQYIPDPEEALRVQGEGIYSFGRLLTHGFARKSSPAGAKVLGYSISALAPDPDAVVRMVAADVDAEVDAHLARGADIDEVAVQVEVWGEGTSPSMVEFPLGEVASGKGEVVNRLRRGIAQAATPAAAEPGPNERDELYRQAVRQRWPRISDAPQTLEQLKKLWRYRNSRWGAHSAAQAATLLKISRREAEQLLRGQIAHDLGWGYSNTAGLDQAYLDVNREPKWPTWEDGWRREQALDREDLDEEESRALEALRAEAATTPGGVIMRGALMGAGFSREDATRLLDLLEARGAIVPTDDGGLAWTLAGDGEAEAAPSPYAGELADLQAKLAKVKAKREKLDRASAADRDRNLGGEGLFADIGGIRGRSAKQKRQFHDRLDRDARETVRLGKEQQDLEAQIDFIESGKRAEKDAETAKRTATTPLRRFEEAIVAGIVESGKESFTRSDVAPETWKEFKAALEEVALSHTNEQAMRALAKAKKRAAKEASTPVRKSIIVARHRQEVVV